VIELLRKRGIAPLEDSDEVSGKTVVIRAHGITPEERQELMACGAKMQDATCPRVTRVQGIIKKYSAQGYDVVVVGDRGHAEVTGLLGYAHGRGKVVENPGEAESFPRSEKLCVVAQTTQNREFFEKAVEILQSKASEVKVFDTLCDSTSRRQKEALELAASSDAVVVVGGRGSANTRRVADICRAAGTPTFHVETEDELDEDKLREFSTIAVTAGASTPNWMIQRALDRIEEIVGIKPSLPGRVLRLGMNLNLQLALGAGCLAVFAALIESVGVRVEHILASSLYILGMHTINNLTDIEWLELNEPGRARFYLRYRKRLVAFAVACALGALVAAARLGVWPLAIVAVASAAGLIYNLRILPKGGRWLARYYRLRDIPASRNLFMALAWGVVTALLPALSFGSPSMGLSVIVAFIIPFTVALARSVTFDLRDIEGDRMVGRETIPVALGKTWTKVLVLVLVSATLLLTAMSAAVGWSPSASYYLLPSVLFIYLYLYLYHIRAISSGPGLDWVVDANFLVIALSLAAYITLGGIG